MEELEIEMQHVPDGLYVTKVQTLFRDFSSDKAGFIITVAVDGKNACICFGSLRSILIRIVAILKHVSGVARPA